MSIIRRQKGTKLPTKKDEVQDDGISQDVADEALASGSETEWETVKVGLGTEWKFESKDSPPLIGLYVGTQDVEIDPEKNEGRTSARAHQFTTAADGDMVFIWGSSEIDSAMEEIGLNEKVRVSYLGRDSFTSDDGPRQIKRYKVERAVTR